ncbi:MAG: hypothetical protein E7311_01800 [Clostridiales bacterium]|nr:hypothetical protein [Clostridiales bacterium]
MGDILEKIFAVILVVILMFFFPLLDSFERMDDLSYMTVYAATVKFVDAVRTTGHITPTMYSEFMQKLNSTGNKYDVEMVHRKSMYYPAKDVGGIAPEHGNVRLDEEFNTEQILFSMGYYTYDNATNTLNETSPTSDEGYTNFSVGDYFYVSVQNTSATPATVIKRVIYGNNVTDLVIMVPYGGMVQNDGK